MSKSGNEHKYQKVCILSYTSESESAVECGRFSDEKYEIHHLSGCVKQSDYAEILEHTDAEVVMVVDADRFASQLWENALHMYLKNFTHQEIGYYSGAEEKLWFSTVIRNSGQVSGQVISSPVFIGPRTCFLRAYAGNDLGRFTEAVGYSLEKRREINFRRLVFQASVNSGARASVWTYRLRYSFQIPFHYVISGEFFRQLFCPSGSVQRDMVWRLLFIMFACFMFVYMPFISRDYGITGDEFMDHRHAGLVLDYFGKGDRAALNQPKTYLHLYGNSVQVIAAAVCRWFHIENCYEARHFMSSLVGALGILFAGFAGLRWGGGLCGLLSLLLMFFTPRFFGHSMNNMKDIPFAVGYIMAVYYTIRLFDYYPRYHLRHIVGVVIGIGLALGTRSGGLILYPMLFMFAGLYYIRYYGVKEFYKFGKHLNAIGNIFSILILVIICSYLVAIVFWPFALQRPFSNVLYSLEKFTHYSIGLRTIFDGEQMMSNMLPWKYAPKYLAIGMPLVTVLGFTGYVIYAAVKKKEFSLLSYFMLFAAIFPIFWVVYKNSNLYGGIRHLLFVMPPIVVIAGRFWSQILGWGRAYVKVGIAVVFIFLLGLPFIHVVRNHPNEYVYFNELAGGMKGAYGNYETDYYFNSLKQSADWFREHVMPGLPKDRKTVIVSQFSDGIGYYFRNDTNIRVIYSRYYEKYSKDWDYAILGNVYVDRFQLQHGAFPPSGSLYAPTIDGYSVSCVVKRKTKEDLKGFQLEKEKRYEEALAAFEAYVAVYPNNEEVWSRMSKLYYTVGWLEKGRAAANKALALHPRLNEALYMMTLINLKLRDYDGAFVAVNKMLEVNSVSVDAYYLRASVYFAQKRYQEAVNDLNKLLSFRPSYDRALVLAGDIFKETGNYTQAVKMYQQALKIKNTVPTQVLLADAYCRVKKFQQAEQALNVALKVEPSYFPIYKVLVRLHLMKGMLVQAGHYLAQLEEIDSDAELFVLRAMYLNTAGKQQEGIKMLEYALKLEPQNTEALAFRQALMKK